MRANGVRLLRSPGHYRVDLRRVAEIDDGKHTDIDGALEGGWLPETPSDYGNRALVLEENGITYSLISDSLSLEEMLKIAESLEP